MTKVDASFGMWLKQRRKTLDLTQDELAHLVGCATVTIRKIEANTLKPSSQIAQRLAQCCNVPEAEHTAFVHFARSEATTGPIWADQTPGAPRVNFVVDQAPHNLVDLPNPLIGRELDVAAINERLASEHVRLLTLVGPPGVGKTRLSLQVAAQQLERFRHGVFVVALAPVSNPQDVLSTIAQTLGIKETGIRRSFEDLKQFLYDREILLVLDNFEQVLPAAGSIDQLIQACYGLKVLVTSREALRLRRERRFAVAPLALATPADEATPTTHPPAVALFIERAQAVNPDFEINQTTLGDISAVCRQLDGLPLSIELIAARSMLLSPKAMLRHLEHQLTVLTSRSADHPQRQRTLREAIRWSVDLLEPSDQQLFMHVGVFPQSCTLDGLAAVGAEQPWALDLLDGLNTLADKSLLYTKAEQQDETRFEMLNVLREYAREMLQQAGLFIQVAQRHANYYLQLAQTLQADLSQHNHHVVAGDRFERDLFNFRAALEFFFGQKQVEQLVQMATNLADLWYLRGYTGEGRRWLAQAIDQAQTTQITLEPTLWIETLNAAGYLAYHQGDYGAAAQSFSQSRQLIETANDQVGMARVYNNLGLIAHWQGQYAQSQALLNDSLEIWRTLDLPMAISSLICNLGALQLDRGELSQAAELLEQSKALCQEHQYENRISMVLQHQGKLALYRGDYPTAQRCFSESYSIAEQMSNKTVIGFALMYQGYTALAAGELEQASCYLSKAAQMSQDLGSKHMLCMVLAVQAQLAVEQAQYLVARQLFTQALELGRSMQFGVGIANALRGLALVDCIQGHFAPAIEQINQAIQGYRTIGNPEGLTQALESLAFCLATMGYGSAIGPVVETVEQLRREYGLRRWLNQQARWQFVQQSLKQAAQMPEQTEPIIEQLLAQMPALRLHELRT
ncbi:tetratricopeptide repeat protein [Herpetosiphon sp. NSE202]|uniref:tetratricopeptide repeat protein n=1 Tax=Herpetosiphon sp. NSE202 TaxID=3351349 RepID=UPI0036424F57